MNCFFCGKATGFPNCRVVPFANPIAAEYVCESCSEKLERHRAHLNSRREKKEGEKND